MGVPNFPPRLDTDLCKPFYEGLAAGELRITACPECGTFYWYPPEVLPCHPESHAVWKPLSGEGTIYSFTTVERSLLPGADPASVPHTILLVEPAEAPQTRMNMCCRVSCRPEAISGEKRMSGPLDGLRIVDASSVMAGSIAGVLLADHGAEVIRIEPKGGLAFSHLPLRKGWERGKTSVELDIADEKDTLLGLLATADVFIHSLADGEAKALGLDAETLNAQFPALIVCALTAYGADTPFADRPYGESLAAARLGAMVEKGNPHRPDTPFYLGHPGLHYGQAFLAAIDILSALRARHETGQGQGVEASLLDSFLAQSPMNWWYHPEGKSYIARGGKASTKGTPFGYTRLITGLFQ